MDRDISAPKPRVTVKRVALWLIWAVLWSVGLIGLGFLGLLIVGEIQFAMLDCGPRRNWGETNYIACSDVDETRPIFFVLGALCTAPLAMALLTRSVLRAHRAGQV